MPVVKVWIHFVWSTKHREPFLSSKEIRRQVFQHIQENAKKKSIYLDAVNGYHDHIHCLISLGMDQRISEVVRLVKGESSFWINKHSIVKGRFEWQTGYFAVSVSESALARTRKYIANQEEHHQKKTFHQEYDDFISKWQMDQPVDLALKE